jgi:hypothetical protein
VVACEKSYGAALEYTKRDPQVMRIPSMSSIPPRFLVASNYNVLQRLFMSVCYEFCNVIGNIGDAKVLAPKASDLSKVQLVISKVNSGLRSEFGLRRAPKMKTTHLDRSYDFFFYVCPHVFDVVELDSIIDWRRRCKTAAVFIIESWSSGLEANKHYLKMLDQFDHVFLFNGSSVVNVQAYTSAPCSFLPTGVDSFISSPYPVSPDRVIDVFAMGRRAPGMHQQLLEMAERKEIFYLYDTVSADTPVTNFREHRLLIANNVLRSRFFVAFDHTRAGGEKAGESRGEQALTHRLFEGASGGSIMLGSAPQCREFNLCFDWPDAVIEVPTEPVDMQAILADLSTQGERIEHIRRMNAVSSLKRHDWVYRWETVLKTMNLELPPRIQERKDRLFEMAEALTRNHFASSLPRSG